MEIPHDPTLKQTIEQIAKQCVANPAFEEVLKNASGANKHAVLLKGKEFVVDTTAEGYLYFQWCVDNLRRQQQSSITGISQMSPQFPQGIPTSSFTQFSVSSSPQSPSPGSPPSHYDIDTLISQYQEPSIPLDNDVPIITATTASNTTTTTITPTLTISNCSWYCCIVCCSIYYCFVFTCLQK